MKARFVEILLIFVTTFSAAEDLSRDQNSKPLQFWPETVLDALTRKWIENLRDNFRDREQETET